VLSAIALWGGSDLLAGRATSQAPASQTQQTPTFRSGVDRVTVDAMVVGKAGEPVRGLTAKDFQLEVAGRPRAVQSVDFVDFEQRDASPDDPDAAVASSTREAFPEVSTNAAKVPGRIIIIVADAASFSPGDERPLVLAGVEFVKKLLPRDRVGLLTIPGGMPNVDVTLDHDRVTMALTQVMGRANAVTPFDVFVGLNEAAEITRQDAMTIQRVNERECQMKASKPPNCEQQVLRQAEQIVLETRLANDARLRSLRLLFDGLAKVEGPKTVVLLSDGLARIGNTMEMDIRDINAAAARSSTSVYAIQIFRRGVTADAVIPPEFDAVADQQLLAEGLTDLAVGAGGVMIQQVGKIDRAFERVAREIAGRYVVSFNVESDDRTGKPRKIELKLPNGSGSLLRYRREFVWTPAAETTRLTGAAAPTAGRSGGRASAGAIGSTPEIVELGNALASGGTHNELRLVASTFTSPDPAAPGQHTTLWVRVAQPDAHLPSATLLFEVLNEKNVRVATSQQTLQAKPGEPLDYVAKMALPSGRYVLRLAARDPDGRLGTVEHPFEARLASAGSLSAGNLMLLDARAMAAGRSSLIRVLPPDAVAFHTFVELQAPASFDWTGVRGLLEVLDPADGSVRGSQPMGVRDLRDPGRRGLEAVVPVAGWKIGTYRVRATIMNGDEPVAAPTRSIVLRTPPPAAASAPDALSATAAPTTAASTTAASTSAAPTSTASTSTSAADAAPASTAAIVGPDGIVPRAMAYVRDYLTQGSSVVAEERYVQIVRRGPPDPKAQDVDEALEWRVDDDRRARNGRDAIERRQLVSDVLMVKTSRGAWTNYRDVAIVDGREVGDRAKRALRLFTGSGSGAAPDAGAGFEARLRKVADESSRYNLARIGNYNIPALPLIMLQPEHAGRFEFAPAGDAVLDGVPTVIVAYRQSKGPTLIHNRAGDNVFMSGRLWIAAGDGRVLRTEMAVQDRVAAWSSQVVVSYRVAPSLGLLMPAEMWERHTPLDSFRYPYVEGRAVYTNFRRFAVTTSETPRPDK
jgi:VWFA-related protein